MRLIKTAFLWIVCFVFLGVPVSGAISEHLVTMDDLVIDDTDFMYRLELRKAGGHLPRNFDKERFLDSIIDVELIAREAKRLNLEERKDYKERLEWLKKDLLVDVYLKRLREGKDNEANHRNYYEENKSKYTAPEKVRIAFISVESPEKAEEIIEKARKGEDFAELAKAYSTDVTATKGGDLGFQPRRALGETFSNVAFNMKKGEIGGPIYKNGKYHIIKLIDRKDAEVIRFEDVRRKVASDYATGLWKAEKARLRKDAKIQINKEALDKLKVH